MHDTALMPMREEVALPHLTRLCCKKYEENKKSITGLLILS